MIGSLGDFDFSDVATAVSPFGAAAGSIFKSATDAAGQAITTAEERAGAAAARGAAPEIQAQIDLALAKVQAEEARVKQQLLFGALAVGGAVLLYFMLRKKR